MTRICFIFIPLAVLIQTVASQEVVKDWTQHIIPTEERSFNFKTVAKGTVPVHRFVLKNPFVETIRIKEITASCTCTTIDFDKTKFGVLKTYEEAIIPIRLQGDMFVGDRNSTITVILDEPSRTEIQLFIRAEIRTDLTITPRNFIDFGNVEFEKGQTRALTVVYRGSNTRWQIVDHKCENEFISAVITRDNSRVGEKIFTVNVSLDKSAPNGVINTHLILLSNDVESRREIPILIRGTVGTVISVTPSYPLYLGILPPGEASTQREVLLRGTKAFRIMKIESDNPALDILLKVNPADPPRILHAIPIVYRNPIEGEGAPEEGVMRATVSVTTDIPDLVPTFYTTATVATVEEGK